MVHTEPFLYSTYNETFVSCSCNVENWPPDDAILNYCRYQIIQVYILNRIDSVVQKALVWFLVEWAEFQHCTWRMMAGCCFFGTTPANQQGLDEF